MFKKEVWRVLYGYMEYAGGVTTCIFLRLPLSEMIFAEPSGIGDGYHVTLCILHATIEVAKYLGEIRGNQTCVDFFFALACWCKRKV